MCYDALGVGKPSTSARKVEQMKMTFYGVEPTFVDEWVAALRSGDYKQGQGYLLYTEYKADYGDYYVEDVGVDRYCCLGVGCNLNRTMPDNTETSDVPWLDTESSDDLARENDTNHKSFAEIADIIEAADKEFYRTGKDDF
jgi:hypothetical protein